MNYIVYRDETGAVHAFGAYCPHRGCDLSLGAIENRQLVCAFHGWRFDEDGRCTLIPAQPVRSTTISAQNRLASYHACERAGFVWIYTFPRASSESMPELPLFPELSADGWVHIPFHTTWKAHFTRVVESVLDVSHLPFVHPETAGRNISPLVEGPEYSVATGRLRIHPTPFAPAHPMEPLRPSTETGERTEIELMFPNCWIIRTPMGDGTWVCTFLTFTPREDGVTDIFGVAMRNFDLDSDFLNAFHIEHTLFVMNQDRVVIESLRPLVAPFDLRREIHVASDGPTIRYRVMLREALESENKR